MANKDDLDKEKSFTRMLGVHMRHSIRIIFGVQTSFFIRVICTSKAPAGASVVSMTRPIILTHLVDVDPLTKVRQMGTAAAAKVIPVMKYIVKTDMVAVDLLPATKQNTFLKKIKSKTSSTRPKRQHYKNRHDNRGKHASGKYRSKRNKPRDYHAALGVQGDASTNEIQKAAKIRRIETHPDKLIKDGMTDQEKPDTNAAAQLIGQAAVSF